MNYSERALAILKTAGAREGDTLLVQGKDGEQKGVLMPHHEFSDPDVIVIKLKSGYNVGIRLEAGVSVKVQDRPEERVRPARHGKTDPTLPTVAVIGTGGTIASYVDYRTGAVHPALSAGGPGRHRPGDRRHLQRAGRGAVLHLQREHERARTGSDLAGAVVDQHQRRRRKGASSPTARTPWAITSAALSFMLEALPRPVRPGRGAALLRPAFLGRLHQPGLGGPVLRADRRRRGLRPDARDLLGHRRGGAPGHQGAEDAHLAPGRVPERQRAAGGVGRLRGRHRVHCPAIARRSAGKVAFKPDMEQNVALAPLLPGHVPRGLREVSWRSRRAWSSPGSGLGHVSADMVKVLKRTVDRRHPGGDDLPVPVRQRQPERLRHRQGPAHRRGDPGRGHAAGDRLRQADVGAGQTPMARKS